MSIEVSEHRMNVTLIVTVVCTRSMEKDRETGITLARLVARSSLQRSLVIKKNITLETYGKDVSEGSWKSEELARDAKDREDGERWR